MFDRHMDDSRVSTSDVHKCVNWYEQFNLVLEETGMHKFVLHVQMEELPYLEQNYKNM